jgi:hypothetical protein
VRVREKGAVVGCGGKIRSDWDGRGRKDSLNRREDYNGMTGKRVSDGS